MSSATVADAIDRALSAYAELTELAEGIEDEWSYVNDLTATWRDQFEAVATARADAVIDGATDSAIDQAIDEIGRITDPHRAIDWLSTFPQVTLIALSEAP